MSPEAQQRKDSVIETLENLVGDGHDHYQRDLDNVLSRPDHFWEGQVQKQKAARPTLRHHLV
jgi:hypothetical protein